MNHQFALQIVKMRIRLKVVSTRIRQDSAVKNMELANAPAVEADLVEERIHRGFITHLNIAYTNPDTSNTFQFYELRHSMRNEQSSPARRYRPRQCSAHQ